MDGVPFATVVFDRPGWQVLEIPVRKPRGTTVVVQIRVAYTVTTAELGLMPSPRRLGVMLKPLRWRGNQEHFRAPPVPPPLPAPRS